MQDHPAPFDGQADSFDERAGLRPEIRTAVGRAVVELAVVDPADRLLEMGAGTGEIGLEIARAGVRYVGFDLSLPMLREFRKRTREDGTVCPILVADGNRFWPVADGSVSAVFGSRSMHLLDPDHAVSETLRVAAPSGVSLLIGRVERDPDSVKATMRRRMRQLLRDRGLRAREGEARRGSLIRAFLERGAKHLGPSVAAKWRVSHSPRHSIESWQRTGGLGGITPPPRIKEEILEELRGFGESTFGALDAVVESEERYVIEGARLAGI